MAFVLITTACGSDQEDARGTGSALSGDVVLDCGPGPVGEIRVEFDCDAITIYSCKDLSNVVLEYENGQRERFEGLSGQRGTFAGMGDNGDARIVRVWVKAGANFSGDGPGYGDRFEAPDGDCDDGPPDEGGRAGNGGDTLDPCADLDPDTFCDEGDAPPGGDEPGEDGPPEAGASGGDPLICTADPDHPTCQVD
jgi:hypothetical protein